MTAMRLGTLGLVALLALVLLLSPDRASPRPPPAREGLASPEPAPVPRMHRTHGTKQVVDDSSPAKGSPSPAQVRELREKLVLVGRHASASCSRARRTGA